MPPKRYKTRVPRKRNMILRREHSPGLHGSTSCRTQPWIFFVGKRSSRHWMSLRWLGGAPSASFSAVLLLACSLSPVQGHQPAAAGTNVDVDMQRHQHQQHQNGHRAAFTLNVQGLRHQPYPGWGLLASNSATLQPESVHRTSERFPSLNPAMFRPRGVSGMPVRGDVLSTSTIIASSSNVDNNNERAAGKVQAPETTGSTREVFARRVLELSVAGLAAATLKPAASVAAVGRRSIEEVKKDVETDFVQR